ASSPIAAMFRNPSGICGAGSDSCTTLLNFSSTAFLSSRQQPLHSGPARGSFGSESAATSAHAAAVDGPESTFPEDRSAFVCGALLSSPGYSDAGSRSQVRC